MSKPVVVALTPVRNESWILPRFFAVTSHFADHILVAYQESSDSTLEICHQHPRVTVIENCSRDFNEAARQRLLIEEARRLVPGPKVLLALDADEILASSALGAPGWQRMLDAEPGTAVEFHVVDLLQGCRECISYDVSSPVAYVDDGAPHVPKAIHSTRVPNPASAKHLRVEDVHVMHYALTRPDACAAKMRFYAVIENLLRTSHVLQRRRNYPAGYDWLAPAHLEEQRATLERIPREWLAGWEAMGIDMRINPTEPVYWYDLAVLEQFRQRGTLRFWLDDVWEFDWQGLQTELARSADTRASTSIIIPPAFIRAAMRLLDRAYTLYCRARHRSGFRTH